MAKNKFTKEELLQAYNYSLGDISCCCDSWCFDFEEVDGICSNCGNATVGGMSVCGCNYSPVACDVCGACPCDYSC